jgi:hypothetical protein
MNSKQNDPRLSEGHSALNGKMPEILVQRQEDARWKDVALLDLAHGNRFEPKTTSLPSALRISTIRFGKFSPASRSI